MKWYFAINQAGTRDQIGLHAKIAVISARKNTDLKPIMLYYGARNEFTSWMTDHDVTVLDCAPQFVDYIKSMDEKQKYSHTFIGHWLRTCICNIETEDSHVLYTDCDVMFNTLRGRDLPLSETFSCAPEFGLDNWNYFNSGVMVMNVPYLRRTYDEFEVFIKNAIAELGNRIRDQYCYNMFYRNDWQRLDPRFNWKPYWGSNQDAAIVHFHGPKLDAIQAVLDRTWVWTDTPGQQIGSLFTGHMDHYADALTRLSHLVGDELPELTERIDLVLGRMRGFEPPVPPSLDFTDFRMFADDRGA